MYGGCRVSHYTLSACLACRVYSSTYWVVTMVRFLSLSEGICANLYLAASQQMGQMGPGAAPMMGPGMDFDKQFQGEAENIEVLAHQCILDDVETRLLASL
jgi:hypothetical protein